MKPAQFQLPNGELKWISILWMVLAVIGVVFGFFTENLFAVAIGTFLMVMTLGIWFQVRACGWILMILYAISAVIILIRDVGMAQEWMRLGKVCLNCIFVWALYQWLNSSEEEDDF